MFIPIPSAAPTGARVSPVVTVLLILLNYFVFIFLQGTDKNSKFTFAYCLVPREVINGYDIVVEPNGDVRELTGRSLDNQVIAHLGEESDAGNSLSPLGRKALLILPETFPHLEKSPGAFVTLFTHMFLHLSWSHISFNMLFLLVFGAGLESLMGHLRYLFFYLVCGSFAGFAAALTTWAVHHGLDNIYALTPQMGASGAIAGIMGGFIVLLPRHDVKVVLVWPNLALGSVPAWVCIGIWIVTQVLEASGITGGDPNVGYAAHIAGFLIGCLLVQTYLSAQKYVSTTLMALLYIFPLVWPALRDLLRNWLEK